MQPTVLSAKFSFQTLFFNVLQHVYSRLVHSKVRHFRTSWWLRFHKHGNAGCESCRTDTTLKSHCSDLFKRQNHISARILFQMVNSEMSRSKDPVQVASRKDLFSIIAYLDGKLPDCCEVSARAVVSKNTQKEHFQSSFRAESYNSVQFRALLLPVIVVDNSNCHGLVQRCRHCKDPIWWLESVYWVHGSLKLTHSSLIDLSGAVSVDVVTLFLFHKRR